MSHFNLLAVSKVIPYDGKVKMNKMNNFIKGITYSYNRNIGWQDRTFRTIIGICFTIGTFYFLKSNLIYAIVLGILAIAQFGTIFSAKCIICYFAGKCSISRTEKKQLAVKGIQIEN